MSVGYGTSVIINAPFELIIAKNFLQSFFSKNAYCYDIIKNQYLVYRDLDSAFEAFAAHSYFGDQYGIAVVLPETSFGFGIRKIAADKMEVSLAGFGTDKANAWKRNWPESEHYDLARYSKLLLSSVKQFEIDSFETGGTDWENPYPYFTVVNDSQPFIELCPRTGLLNELPLDIDDIITSGIGNGYVFFDSEYNRLIDQAFLVDQIIAGLMGGREIFYNVSIKNHLTQVGFKLGPYKQLVVGVLPQCSTIHAKVEAASCDAIFFLENSFALVEDFAISSVIGRNLNKLSAAHASIVNEYQLGSSY